MDSTFTVRESGDRPCGEGKRILGEVSDSGVLYALFFIFLRDLLLDLLVSLFLLEFFVVSSPRYASNLDISGSQLCKFLNGSHVKSSVEYPRHIT